MSMLSVFSYEALPQLADVAMGVNYGTDKVRFVSPVKAGSRIRGRFTLTEATLRKPKELFTRTSVSVEIDGEDKPALVADWLGLVYFN
jgi:acyl dehydratase